MAFNDSEKYIKSVSMFNGGGVRMSNVPKQYEDRKRQYMAERNAMFDSQRSYLATDYMNADVQGVAEDFYEWVNTNIRLADISSGAVNATKRTDDFKQVLFPELGIDYFPIGAKIKTMGNTWLCINPSNISTAKTTAVVARCNASYNSYDYYGNVITEPIFVQTPSMQGNDNEHKQNIVLMDGSFNITCQLNGNTEQLKENSRIILGKKPYHITGLVDFIQEFSGDRESCHLLTFTARVEEHTEKDDITKNFIANGKEYDFDCVLQSTSNLSVGESVPFIAHFVKNGEIVESTDKYPITWKWESSDESVAVVDKNGNVNAVSIGDTKITAKMVQNTNISVSVELAVKENKEIENRVVFTGIIPECLSQYDSIVIPAAYFSNGKETNEALEWCFDGADEKDYSVEISKDGKSVEITCISPSEECLEITASYGDKYAIAIIELVGY